MAQSVTAIGRLKLRSLHFTKETIKMMVEWNGYR